MRYGRKLELDPWAAAVIGLPIAVLLQTALIPALLPGAPRPDPAFALMIAMAVLGHRAQSVALALAGGLALDALTGQYIGLNAVSYLVAVLAVSRLQGNLVKEALTAPAAAMFSGYLVRELVYLFVLVSVGLKFVPLRVAAQLMISSALNALIGTALYWLLHFKLGIAVRVDRGF